MCVLVVEDDDDFRAALCSWFEEAGFETLEARDGLEALALARLHGPRAIVLDLLLPEVDGLQLMALLDADPQLAEIPRFVLSAFIETVGEIAGVPAFPKQSPAVVTRALSGRQLLN